MIKTVLFDMDGVLIDAKDWHYEALNRALQHFGYSIDPDSHLTTFDGLPTRQKLRMLVESRGLPKGLVEFINRLKQDYTLEISAQRCRPVFNHRYALARLKSEGMQLGVCSNSVRATVDNLMSLSGLAGFMDVMLSNEDVGRSKPDPEMYVRAMETLGVPPEDCLIVEDNDHGVQAAIASGAHLLRVNVPDDVTYWRIRDRIAEIPADQGR